MHCYNNNKPFYKGKAKSDYKPVEVDGFMAMSSYMQMCKYIFIYKERIKWEAIRIT